MLLLLLACAPAPPVPAPSGVPEPLSGSTLGDPATQVGAEGTKCTGCLDALPATVIFPERAASLDTQVVLVTPLSPESLDLALLGEEEVSGSLQSWPLLGGGHALLLTPDALLAPEADYEVEVSSMPIGGFRTGVDLSGEPGRVEVLSLEPLSSGGLQLELLLEVQEPSWVRIHPDSCDAPTEALLAVASTGDTPELTVKTLGTPECACAVVVSADGTGGPPSEVVCR
jgi:hypothetical protein